MVRKNGTSSNGQTTPTARVGYADLKWWEQDTLMCAGDVDNEAKIIAVTDGRPSRPVQRAYTFFRRRDKVQRLIDAGFLQWFRTDTYGGGQRCDVYRLSRKGQAELDNWRAGRRAYWDTFRAQDAAETEERHHQEAVALLHAQFPDPVDWDIEKLHDQISQSNLPFIDAPAISGFSIRTCLIYYWQSSMPRDVYKRYSEMLLTLSTWTDAIGEEDAMQMLIEKYGTGDSDGDDDDE